MRISRHEDTGPSLHHKKAYFTTLLRATHQFVKLSPNIFTIDATRFLLQYPWTNIARVGFPAPHFHAPGGGLWRRGSSNQSRVVLFILTRRPTDSKPPSTPGKNIQSAWLGLVESQCHETKCQHQLCVTICSSNREVYLPASPVVIRSVSELRSFSFKLPSYIKH